MVVSARGQTNHEVSWNGETIKLVTKGRVSGLPHIVRVRFVRDGEDFLVLAGSSKSDWVKNIEREGRARVRSESAAFEARAWRSPAEIDKVIGMFEKKYGGRLVAQWYPRSSVCVRLSPEGPAVVTKEVKGEGSATKSFADWKGERKGYYGEVASAFDSASEEYDVTIGKNFINTLIRQRSLEVLFEVIRPEDTLVEVGAGTGAEATQIARRVSGIVATDISQSMVDLLTLKARARGLQDRIISMRLPAAEIRRLRDMLPGGTARVVYSFNGALNCEPRLDKFVSGLTELVRPGGYFVCSIRNTFCLCEVLTYAALLRPAGMTKRKAQPMMVSVGAMDIPSTYYPASTFAAKFRQGFRLVKMVGLPVLLPPAYLNDYYVRARGLLKPLEGADRALASRFPFNRLGDQTLYVFRRNQAVPPG